MARRAASLLFLIAPLSCSPGNPLKRLDTWWVFEEPGFSMRLPPEVRGGPVRGVDSSVGVFESSSLRLSYDYGMCRNFSDDVEIRREEWTVDGQAAEVRVSRFPSRTKEFGNSARIYFSEAGEAGANLTVFAWFASEEHLETVREIFRSILFSPRRR